jgi:hypothetical protein
VLYDIRTSKRHYVEHAIGYLSVGASQGHRHSAGVLDSTEFKRAREIRRCVVGGKWEGLDDSKVPCCPIALTNC